MGKRGPKPLPLVQRIAPKILIRNQEVTAEYLANLIGVPPDDWPNVLHDRWVWIGQVSVAKHRTQRTRDRSGALAQYVQFRPGVPQLKVAGKKVQAYRPIWELFRGPIPEGHHLRYTLGSNTNRMDVNPAHFEPKHPKRSGYTVKPEDFSQPMLDIDDLAELFEEQYMLRPFRSMAELRERMQGDLDDVPSDLIPSILKKAGLLERISQD